MVKSKKYFTQIICFVILMLTPFFSYTAEGFRVEDYLAKRDRDAYEDQLIARDGTFLFILERYCPRSRVHVYNMVTNKTVVSVDLEGSDWFTGIGWSSVIKKLICMDPDGALVLIGPDNGWKQEVIQLQKPAFPTEMGMIDDLLLVSHHNEWRLDAFVMRDGTISYKNSYDVKESSFVILDRRYCLLGGYDVRLLDLESEEITRLINIPEWQKGATNAECLEYDAKTRTAYFYHDGKFFAYVADPAQIPDNARLMNHTESMYRINNGYLYQLNPEYYRYDEICPSIISYDGVLSIITTNSKGEKILLSQSGRLAPGGTYTTCFTRDPQTARLRFALLRADEIARNRSQTGSTFARDILAARNFVEQSYSATFKVSSVQSFVQKLGEDEVLCKATAGSIDYQELPFDACHVMMYYTQDLPETSSAIKIEAIQSNPWNEHREGLLGVKRLSGSKKRISGEEEDIMSSLDAYEIPSGAMRLGKDQIVFTFSLWCNPRNLAEEEERVREHLSRRYPEFMELQKTVPR